MLLFQDNIIQIGIKKAVKIIKHNAKPSTAKENHTLFELIQHNSYTSWYQELAGSKAKSKQTE